MRNIDEFYNLIIFLLLNNFRLRRDSREMSIRHPLNPNASIFYEISLQYIFEKALILSFYLFMVLL